MSFYVLVIRTDTDIETGYGPFDDRDAAQSMADRLNHRMDVPEWFDSAEVTTREPADGCRKVRA